MEVQSKNKGAQIMQERFEVVFEDSVAMAIADVFSKNRYTVPNKIAKILRIFDGLETLKS